MFKVVMASHAHYMDPDEHYVLGEFEIEQEAVEACKHVVRSSIAEVGSGWYSTMGDDPFIVATDGSVAQLEFSSWKYAKTLNVESAEAE